MCKLCIPLFEGCGKDFLRKIHRCKNALRLKSMYIVKNIVKMNVDFPLIAKPSTYFYRDFTYHSSTLC